MSKVIYFSLFVVLTINVLLAQSGVKFPNQNLSVELSAGLNIPYTDYQEQTFGPVFRAGLHYFIYSVERHRVSLGFQFAYQQVKGEDNRISIPSNDGLRELSPTFSTNIISPGLYSEYNFLINEQFFVFARLSTTYNVFNPKNNKGEDGWAYSQGLYNKEFFTLTPELGIKVKIDENIDLSFGFNYSLAVTDYIDDIATSTSNDSYANILFGLSYSFFSKEDETQKSIYDGLKTEHTKIKTPPVIDEQKEKVEEPVIKPQPEEKPAVQIEEKEEQVPAVKINQILLPGDDAFYEGSARFKPDIYQELDRIVEIINQDPESRWRIEGHMDSQGMAASIKRISQERARAVYDYFILKGVRSDRLKIYGLADNFPIANNNTAEGRSTNRRIMIIREN